MFIFNYNSKSTNFPISSTPDSLCTYTYNILCAGLTFFVLKFVYTQHSYFGEFESFKKIPTNIKLLKHTVYFQRKLHVCFEAYALLFLLNKYTYTYRIHTIHQ